MNVWFSQCHVDKHTLFFSSLRASLHKTNLYKPSFFTPFFFFSSKNNISAGLVSGSVSPTFLIFLVGDPSPVPELTEFLLLIWGRELLGVDNPTGNLLGRLCFLFLERSKTCLPISRLESELKYKLNYL